MKRQRPRQELDEEAYLRRAWRHSRATALEAVLAGPHGEAARALIDRLKNLTTGAALVRLVQSGPWQTADSGTQAEILSVIDRAIVRQRERAGLTPFDDPLPGALPNVFIVLRDWLRGEQISRERARDKIG
jgi:hypothetical protein